MKLMDQHLNINLYAKHMKLFNYVLHIVSIFKLYEIFSILSLTLIDKI